MERLFLQLFKTCSLIGRSQNVGGGAMMAQEDNNILNRYFARIEGQFQPVGSGKSGVPPKVDHLFRKISV